MIPRSLEMEVTALASMSADRRQAIKAGAAFDKPAEVGYCRDIRAARSRARNTPRASMTVALSPLVAGPRRCDLEQLVGGWALLPVSIDRVASLKRSDIGKGRAVPSVAVRLVSVEGATVAVVDVHGVLTRWGWADDASGSTAIMADVIRQLAADADVDAIALHVDSPGGSVGGIAGLGDAVFEARHAKPTVAIVDELAASGAYWVASQASAIFASNAMSRVGSIGAYAVIWDFSEALKARGIRINVFRSGPLKGAGIDALSDAQRAALQREVDETAATFKGFIRRGRGIDAKLLDGLATGEVFRPTFAKEAGLIDGVLSFNEVVYALARSVKGVAR